MLNDLKPKYERTLRMKKIISLMLAVIIFVPMLPCMAMADENDSIIEFMSIVESDRFYSENGNVSWTLDSDGVLSIEGTGDMPMHDSAQFEIWREYENDIKSIVIGDKITGIGGNAFHGFTNLTSVTIGSHVVNIGDYSFNYCTSLEEIVLPDSVTSIGRGAFSGCMALTNIIIPDSVVSIGSEAFSDCTSLAEIVMSESTVNIGVHTFNNTAYYNDADNWDSGMLYIDKWLVEANPDETFDNCIIKSEIFNIANGAFTDCKDLISIDTNNVTNIGEYAFNGCVNLTSVYMNNVTDIRNHVFDGCVNLTSIYMNSVTNIGDYAFNSCLSLNEITIPESVMNIGCCAFENCIGIRTVYFNAVNCTVDNNESLFGTCIEKLIVGNHVTKIPNYAFYGCVDLKRVSFPNTLKQIGEYSFYDSGLKQVDIPEFVTSIGVAAFSHCSDLENIYVDSKNPKYYSDNGVLLNKYQNRLLICPGAKETYVIPDTVTYVERLAFSGCVNLSEIELTENITDLGDFIFLDATGIEAVKYNCKILNNNAFENCSNLISVNLGNNVNTIYGYAFIGCKNLKELTIPENVYKISEADALDGIEILYWNAIDCLGAEISSSVKEVYFGDNVEAIPGGFLSNSRIENIKIPESITKIYKGAFNNCDYLTEITIPDGVKSIGYESGASTQGTFSNCENLTKIKIPNSVSYIDNNTFENCNGDLTIIGYRNSYAEDFAYKHDIMFSALDDKTEDYYTYLVENNRAVITSVDNSISGDIIIPSSLGGYTVTEIGSYAFSGCRNLVNVTIPQNVARIGINAFYNCSSLESIDIPQTVEYIGEYAFSGCHMLNSINLPQNITKISPGMFYDCTALSSIDSPDDVTSIGNYAFSRSGLTEISIPNGVTVISQYMFFECLSLKSVQFGANTKEIGIYAFSGTSLENVEIPETVVKIGASAFLWCKNLMTVVIDNAPVTIDEYAFYRCPKLSVVSLGNYVQWIGGRAFYDTALKELTVPKSVTSIGAKAFPADDDFVVLGYMGSCAERYCGINGYMFLKNDKMYEHYYYLVEDGEAIITGTDGLLSGTITLPDTIDGYPVTGIGQKAFMSRKSIIGIQIPESITEIAYNAFSDCKGLILQGNDFVYEYTIKNGLSYSSDLTQNQIDFVTVDNMVESENGMITGDVTLELDSHMNSFIDLTNVYLVIYCDGKMVKILQSSMLPEMDRKKSINFKDIGVENPEQGEYTMKILVWDDGNLRPFADVYSSDL